MALANRPDLLIADEPTTALDATVQRRLLDGLEERRRALGLAMILVTHDLRLARRYASRLYVMQDGRVVEAGETSAVFAAPRAPYTRNLIEAAPRRPPRRRDESAPEALGGRDLRVAYGRRRAVDGVDLCLRCGRTLAVVGESGSGKSTLARALAAAATVRGRNRLDGSPGDAPRRRSLAAGARAGADRVSGPLRRVVAALEGRRHRRRGLAGAGRPRKARRRARSPRSASIPRWRRGRPTRCPAASANASPSPGRWRSNRLSSRSTNRRPRWIGRRSAISSRCSAVCRPSAVSPISSSPMILTLPDPWPTTLW